MEHAREQDGGLGTQEAVQPAACHVCHGCTGKCVCVCVYVCVHVSVW